MVLRSHGLAHIDPEFLEDLYTRWQKDPASLDESWQLFFQGFDLASCPRSCDSAEQAADQSRIASLIFNYRSLGHRLARIDPLAETEPEFAELDLDRFGFSDSDLDRVFDTGHGRLPQRSTLREIVAVLKETYCASVGVEYLHIQDVDIRRWLQDQMEPRRNRIELDAERQREILQQLADAELFETFTQRRYLGQKRFSLEGGETLIPLLHWMIELAPESDVGDVLIGMAHRGRLNVLANILDKSYATLFSEFEDNFTPGSVGGDGDVKYHKGFSSVHDNRNGKAVELSLTANPSHLEAVGPVVLGRARAKQRRLGGEKARNRVLPIIIHGDAAFAGQGVVAETFNMSRLAGYDVGGAVHVVLNNQIGFTTLPGQARSSLYATDVAKMVEAPIFHVNGDDPEAAVHVADLAFRYRQEFGRDVVIDLVCYRRHGHSEVDDPGFTQPDLVRRIKAHPTVSALYADRLVAREVLTRQEVEAQQARFEARLDEAYRLAREGVPETRPDCCELEWTELENRWSDQPVDTAVPRDRLELVARGLTAVPEGFSLHPKVGRLLLAREQAVSGDGAVDWSLAEALAFGTLLLDGVPVRLSGQDSERGTFSQRHAVWRDLNNATAHVPLNHLQAGQAVFCAHNSPLSEASVLGFEYGYSLAEPQMLNLWEAQFGDFANGAQVIIDQFLVAARSKWQRESGLVLLLPHGYEGQGPEHSNAYLERYLAACAEQNIQVCSPSTPAQYFHLLRRQLMRSFRRPLVVMTPKSMLRHQLVVSELQHFTAGRFEEVIGDPVVGPEAATRLVLCSGKVYYDMLEQRAKTALPVALVRLEQLYPFPEEGLRALLARYAQADLIWTQEEPQNRGAWTFVEPRFRRLAPKRPLAYVGRPASASPAVGSLKAHRSEQAAIVSRALGVGEES